ncbi:hypothetical protein GPL17_33580 [Bradyrhizobium yuanmingense]|uniref:nSTAND3 domain-containing NTPase n=1 Tax=Bradyrhizobium yuanmingense TaxID=108015 RepID=UPI0012F82F56|nr:hypothetical protein [Bradyrhizobium yuanmingense]MVT55365.1 hypothetical protein [Bradyrhizobium yuanmingense]
MTYPLHLLGWKAFQDLCIALAEECLRRPVQNFLPGNDAGRDGAFVGRWDGDDPGAGASTIQCKFTSKPSNLSLSILSEELEKARKLAKRRLAADYIILTNHAVSGASELKIKEAFEKHGVGRCRVFGYEWIVRQVRSSPRLRMMAPRLYGLGDLNEFLDERAYAQAQLILSAMGNDLQRLVVTEAHRKSVRAISAHNLVLLLGAPAAGKSTIGASLAIGAADIWQCATIKVTSPQELRERLSPGDRQFFWIDDAWGNTQYQRQTSELWNQVFPLMQAAVASGARFLMTSRDYIWQAARGDLKFQALPILSKSQVVINVHELSTQEKAQILYNHVKLGDQPPAFRAEIKPSLPEIAERKDFLPETARRLGSSFFAGAIDTSRESLLKFFAEPEQFLLETITNLSADCRAAIAVVFMNGAQVRSPVSEKDIAPAANAFGVTIGAVREQLVALNGSLLLLSADDHGQFWTYKHPTVSDAFAHYVAQNAELVDIYLRGAKPDSIAREVVCAGCIVTGAPVIVPDSLHGLLAKRLSSLEDYRIASFLSYRANKTFSLLMLGKRPDVLDRLLHYHIPIKDDTDADLAIKLHDQGLLPSEHLQKLKSALENAAIEHADASFLQQPRLGAIFTDDEREALLDRIETELFQRIDDQISHLRGEWDSDSPPDEYFDLFESALRTFVSALSCRGDYSNVLRAASDGISRALSDMYDDYRPSPSTTAPTSSSTPQHAALSSLFRDVDE